MIGTHEHTRTAMKTIAPCKPPFPYFGGKTLAAPLIWQALGNCVNYVEPFAGSLAVLLQRPHAPQIETCNDKDAFLANVWRALQADPEAVAQWCDRPPNEADLHAIHTWLVNQRDTFTARLMGDPDYYDPCVAGRWLYGIACWIGGGWCSGDGPWQSVDGQLRHLGNAGHNEGLYAWFAALQERLRYVRVCCGDWQRVLGPSVTWNHGLTGMVFDPPYSQEEDRDMGLYACEDGAVAYAVRAWALAHGEHPLLRIVMCAYGEIHDELLAHGWRKVSWTAHGGMGNQGEGRGRANKHREVLYLSPQCLTIDQERQLSLFA